MFKLIFDLNLLTTERLLEIVTWKNAYEAVKIMSVSSRRIDLSVGEATSGRNDRHSVYKKFKTTLFSRRRSHCSKFVDLNTLEKVKFLFNNIDLYVCKKKLGFYVYEAFQLRKFYSMKQ